MKRTGFKRKLNNTKKVGKGYFDHLKKESKVEEWKRVLSELKERFTNVNILSCELKLDGCTRANNFGWSWGFAHSKKREEISTDLTQREVEIRQVVYACGNCHDLIEHLPRDSSPNMYNYVCSTIQKRLKQP